MLGTGTPAPHPERSGPATAIVVNGTSYLIDFGPGVIRRAQAAYEKGIAAMGCGAINLRTAFLTHLHMDHTAGYPDLILTPWIMGRRKPLEVFGPIGLKAMTKHVLQAWRVDIENRVNGPDKLPPAGSRVNVHEIAPGLVYEDRNIRVTAFPVSHGELRNAFGFRFETPDRTIVISGDTAPTQTTEKHCEGCDVLIHEAYSQDTYAKVLSSQISYVFDRTGPAREPSQTRSGGSLSPRQCRRRAEVAQPGTGSARRDAAHLLGQGRHRPRSGYFLNRSV